MKEPRENPANGPMQDRRERGVAKPERNGPIDPDNTPDQQGIEIDHAKERPNAEPL